MFDMDSWMPSTFAASPFQSSLMPSTLDIFDPFDELDRMMSRNLRWIDRPFSYLPVGGPPVVPQKYRISVNCAGFSPDNIKTELKDQNNQKVLFVHAKEELGRKDSDDYSKKELRKTFILPNDIDYDKMASFMAPGGTFIVEFPIRETAGRQYGSLLPQYAETPEGGQIKMNFPLPQNIDPNKVQVSIKDRDLIMRVEDKTETPDAFSRVHIYTRTTLPENTDFNQLKCIYDNNQLTITAPVIQGTNWGSRNIPLEMKGLQQQISGGQQQQITGGQQQQITGGQQQQQQM